jgi:hypothetical protein
MYDIRYALPKEEGRKEGRPRREERTDLGLLDL